MPAGGSRMPPSHETVDKRLHYVKQEGQQVFKYAVRKMYESCTASARTQQTDAGGHRLPDPAPGEQANHLRRGGADGHAAIG